VTGSAPRPRIELLGAQHDRAGFVCGKDAFDNYFQRQITQDMRRHLATPFVMIMPDGAIGGFYTLSSTALRLHELPEDVTKRLPRYPLVPATLIGRLALDRRCHGQGWGSFLLLDALYRCTMRDIASFAVVVDAIDDEARSFYLHAGFLPLPDSPYRLFRRMSDIEALFT
jgi:GNAT superfamily N-acetyltransferase